MKKSSKLVSLFLAVLMCVSTVAMTVVSASAAEEETTKIYFEFPEEVWGISAEDATLIPSLDNPAMTNVYAYIYNVSGDGDFPSKAWGNRAWKCTYEGNGIYSYDMQDKLKATLKEGADYAVIFSYQNGPQTCNVTFGTPCLGGTIALTGGTMENTDDSSKTDFVASWTDPDLAAVYGPKLVITSTGKVLGEVTPTSQTHEQLVSNFIHDWAVKNTSLVSAESVAAICADEKINVAPADVYKTYASDFAGEIEANAAAEDPENLPYPYTASFETVAQLLGVDPSDIPDDPIDDPTPDPTPDPVEEYPVYVVAGSEALCGVNWAGGIDSGNVMAKADGVCTLTFENVQPAEGLQLKVVANAEDGTQEWIGDATGNNVTFNVTTACDVTVTFVPETKEITVTGEGVEFVTELEINAVYAVGNGDEAWLNGVAWGEAATENMMSEISDGVYQISYRKVASDNNWQVKFAANGAWTDSWGGVCTGSGVPFEAVYNGSNITVDTSAYEYSDVTLTIDLSAFDYATKTGAVAVITVEEYVPDTAYRYGDANMDGILDINDVTDIQLVLALYTTAEINETLADVNQDGIVDIQDVTAIQKYLASYVTGTGVTNELSDITIGGESTPDVATPDVATPDVATPDEATPDVATPDVATPDEAAGGSNVVVDAVASLLSAIFG